MSIERQLKADAEAHSTSHYVWVTAGDDRVRPEHAAREGQIFPYVGSISPPGSEPGCRCKAVPYYGTLIDDKPLEPVYPELFFFPLLRIGRLFEAWQAYSRVRSASRNWQLSPTKSAVTWRNRMERGSWTPDKISQTIRNGKAYATKNERTGGAATRYEKDGYFVVRDDSTGNILQLSGHDFVPKNILGKSL